MLCDPVSYTGTKPILVSVALSSGRIFSIQHFSIDTDLEELYHQFFLQATAHWDISGLLKRFKQSFESMAESHTSQAFIVSLDQQHIFEIEVHEAIVHQAQLPDFSASIGEFSIQISAGHWLKTTRDLYAQCLHQTVRYFFQFPEVHRILINSSLLPPPIINSILLPAGFFPIPGHPTIYALHP